MTRLAWILGGAAVALALLGALVASSWPDGLERVAATLGFASRGSAALGGSPFADYQTRFLQSRWPAQASAGLLGVALLYGFGALFARVLRRSKR